MKRNGLNAVGVIFGIISILIVISSAVILLGVQPFNIGKRIIGDLDIQGFVGPKGRFEESGEKRIEGPVSEVEISNIAGDITVKGWDEDYILLKYSKFAPTEAVMDNILIEIDKNDDEVSIRRESDGSVSSWRGSISFELNIPIETVEKLSAKSISGMVICSNMSPNADLDLQSTSGRIETDNANDLFVKSISGSVDFIFNGGNLDINTTSGRIEGMIQSIEPDGKIDLRSVSGSVRIAAPDGFGARVDLRSVSGSVSTEFPVKVHSSKRNSLEGTIGDGGVDVDIDTTSGSIKIRKTASDG